MKKRGALPPGAAEAPFFVMKNFLMDGSKDPPVP